MKSPLRLHPPQPKPPSRLEAKTRLRELLSDRPDLAERLKVLRDMGRRVRACEVHLTTTCNIRCKGCWYFEGGFDTAVPETSDLGVINALVEKLVHEGVTQATLIGGEPTLVQKRILPFIEKIPYITISSNGLRPLPTEGFENVGVAISLFGGGPMDDQLRAHRPNGSSFTGLFETALKHYRDDPRVTFVLALNEDGLEYVEATVRAIADNGNLVSFNFYSAHGTDHPLRMDNERREHAERVRNGNPVLDGFAVYGADFKTLQFCCTSGNCGECRDSQGVYSWLLVSMNWFLDSAERLETWLEIAESYWRQWYWAQRCSPNFARTS